MPGISGRLAELGIQLPPAPAAVASYLPARVSGGLVYVSGQLPMVEGKLLKTGVVPNDVSEADAAACAQQCAINAIAAAAEAVGGVDRLGGVVKVGVFVACRVTHQEHPQVADGASELFQEVFGEAGRHARAAIGCVSLPLGSPVEVEAIFEIAAD